MKSFFLRFIATVGFIGNFTKFPGTLGSLAALPLIWGIGNTGLVFFGIILVLFFVGRIASAHVAETEGNEDPSHVIIDEVVGMMLSVLFIPLTLWSLTLGFILFRFFDIAKPLYIKKLEIIPKGYGVMLDDVLAGIYANIILRIILTFVS